MSGLRSEPLASCHDRAGFTCGVAALDNYLRRQASQDVRRHVAAVFVMVDDPRVRENRLRLLGEIADTVNGIAHFHQLGTKLQRRDPSLSV